MEARWRRQHPCGPFVLDFFCAEAKLAVEVDGAAHGHPGQIAHDRRRDAWLGAQGVRVLRVDAQDVLEDAALDGVLAAIAALVTERREQ
jgi:very-short-patch-repair endonuclease